MALLLKPFAALLLFAMVLPVRFLVGRMKESRLKRLLLLRIHDRW